MYESAAHLRVRYAETDQMNVVYYGNYAQYFEVGRVESIRQLGYTYKDMEASGIIMPVVEFHVKYLRSATYDDLLTIKTQIRELPESYRIEFFQEVYNEEKKLLAAGKVVLYFLNAKTWERTTMPEEMKKKLLPFFENNKK
ncbi:MAG: thioesterase family protein [Parafilimonas sp.]